MTDLEMYSEERIYRDCNGFYNGQIRFRPLEDWERAANDGWRSFCVSPTLDWVLERIRPEFRERPIVDAYHNI